MSGTLQTKGGITSAQEPEGNPVFRRLLLWLFFGALCSALPLIVVALHKWFPNSGLSGFLRLISNADLLAVCFTLALAAAGDVLTSGNKLRQIKWFCGLLTLFLAFVAAMLYTLFEMKATNLTEHQTMRSIQEIYIACMIGALVCELLAEVQS